MEKVLSLAQGWWSVAGLALDIAGFVVIAFELFLTTRIPLIEACVDRTAMKYAECIASSGLTRRVPKNSKEDEQNIAWTKEFLTLLDTCERRIVIPCLAECRSKLGGIVPFSIAPAPGEEYLSRRGLDVHSTLNPPSLIDRFLPGIDRLHSKANSVRKFVPAAILAVVLGFGAQIVGSWPMSETTNSARLDQAEKAYGLSPTPPSIRSPCLGCFDLNYGLKPIPF